MKILRILKTILMLDFLSGLFIAIREAIKTKKNIMQTFNLNSMKALEIDIFFQNLISRLERNLLNKNLNMLLENQNEIKQMIKDMVVSVNLDDI